MGRKEKLCLEHDQRTVRRGEEAHPRRREQPCAGVPFGRRRPDLHQTGKGIEVYDADGRAYIDYVLSWGPAILGHAHPKVTAALRRPSRTARAFGAPTELEITLAKMVKKAVPSIELVRMVSSGTEATMSAIRAAGVHGPGQDPQVRWMLPRSWRQPAGKGGKRRRDLRPAGQPRVPVDLAKHTLTVAFNDLAAVRDICSREGERIACIIVSPLSATWDASRPCRVS